MINRHIGSISMLVLISACAHPVAGPEISNPSPSASIIFNPSSSFDPLADLHAPPLVSFSKTEFISTPEFPRYPPEAKAQHIQGEVIVEVWIDSMGVPVKSVALLGPSEFRKVSESYCSGCRFKPFLVDGKPGNVRFRMAVLFRLP